MGQIAKIKGCRTVGIAGGPEKCRRIIEEFGFDDAIDYHSETDLAQRIRALCPDGSISISTTLAEACWRRRLRASQPVHASSCAVLYRPTKPGSNTGTANLWQLLVKSARLEGFLFSTYAPSFGTGLRELGTWVREGRIAHREEIIDDIGNTVAAFRSLFSGGNAGKLTIKVNCD